MSETPENQQQYGSILTVLGENAEQNGKLQNKQITFSHIAIGDANDTYVQPDRQQTALTNELARIPVNSVDVLQPTPESVPMLKVEAILPDDVNDLVIREFAAVATFDGNTYFHAVGNCARIYVPDPVNNGNVSTPVTLEMIFVITSADPIVEIDPLVVTASREYVRRNAPRRFATMAEALRAVDFVENDIVELSSFDTRGYGKSTWIGTGVKDGTKSGTFDRTNGKFYGADGSECRYQFRSLVDPEQWGAIPNDETFDNQRIIEDAAAYLPSTGALLLANMTFYARNLFWPNKTLRITSLIGGSTLRSIDEGENSPFIEAFSCPLSWKNGSSWVSSPLIFKDIKIDGGDKKRAHVVHYYFGRHTDFTVDGGTENALCMTARSLNGPISQSTMVNNRFVNFEAFGSAKVGFFVDEDGKTTDWELVGAYLWNAGETNIDARTLGGALITDLHCFSSPVSMRIKKWSTGTRINNLYLEKDLVINEGLYDDRLLMLGPNVDVTGNVELNFGAVSGPIKSINNTFRSKVKHNYYGAKKFISHGDTFDDADPLVFHNNDANNAASFELSESFIKGELRSGNVTTSDKTLLDDGYVEYPIKSRVPVTDSSNTLQFNIPVVNNANSTESYKVEVLLTGQYNNYQQFGRSVVTFIVTTQVRYNQEPVIVSIDEVNRDEQADYSVGISGVGTLTDGVTITMTPAVNATHSTGAMQVTITHKLQGSKYANFV